MAKKSTAAATRQLAARVPLDVHRRLEAIRAVLQLTQAATIEAALAALEKRLSPDQRRAYQFFLDKA